MRLLRNIVLLAFLGTAVAQAQFPSGITHVVVVFQENRTPDNLFQGLCSPVTITPCPYNIQSTYLNESNVATPLSPVGLANNFDLDHSHIHRGPGWGGFVDEVSKPSQPATPVCAALVGAQRGRVLGCAPSTSNQFMYVDNSVLLTYTNAYGSGTTHILDPYLTLAKEYGWANHMHQTNQGPSYPAHQFIFGGTSAPTTADDGTNANGAAQFVAENPQPQGGNAGCIGKDTDYLISPNGTEAPGGGNPDQNWPNGLCFDHPTLATLLDKQSPAVTWKYYAPNPGSIWTAPASIQDLCGPVLDKTTNQWQCKSPEWQANVVLQTSEKGGAAKILSDIQSCQLANVSWVIPDGKWSDHADDNDGLGPSWVAAIVNSVADWNNSNHCGYWQNTAIIITWDDWGGWYDHEKPQNLPGNQGDYQLGFRVPLLVVSAYTRQNTIDDTDNPLDFGSILNTIEEIFKIPAASLQFADWRAQNYGVKDLRNFFNLTSPRAFTTGQVCKGGNQCVVAAEDMQFFLDQATTASPPDDY